MLQGMQSMRRKWTARSNINHSSSKVTCMFCRMQAEFESRCEMYEAQVTKMQRSMERSDSDKAKVEEQLARAMALTHSGDKQVGCSLPLAD